MPIFGMAMWRGNGQMFHLQGLKIFRLDELVPWLKRKCFEKYEYFEESGYILLNFMCILVLLPGTSF
jgi:hypothetical protein